MRIWRQPLIGSMKIEVLDEEPEMGVEHARSVLDLIAELLQSCRKKRCDTSTGGLTSLTS